LSNFQKRREIIYNWMNNEKIALIMIEDSEGKRNTDLRWLSGQPGDSLLFLSAQGKSLLVPWDINLAKIYADADQVLPYGEFERQPVKALKKALEYFKIIENAKIEIPGTTSYPSYVNFTKEIPNYNILCRENGVAGFIEQKRAIKDDFEIKLYRKLSGLTDEIINMVEKGIFSNNLKTEADVALFIENESRKMGCEGVGFDIIAAGPARSFGIHAFPSYTGENFRGKGLSILDFGLKLDGYTSDVTLTFAKEPLSKPQAEMVSLVKEASQIAISMAKNGERTRNISLAVDKFFSNSGKTMPHALGHGIGLDAHEAPSVRSRIDNEWILEPGMILALEPGLYDPVHGGCRLENDVLITEENYELLTNSRIIHL